MANPQPSSDPTQIHATPDNVWLKGKTVWGILAAGVGAFVVLLPTASKLAWDASSILVRLDARMENQEIRRADDRAWMERRFEDVTTRIKSLEASK